MDSQTKTVAIILIVVLVVVLAIVVAMCLRKSGGGSVGGVYGGDELDKLFMALNQAQDKYFKTIINEGLRITKSANARAADLANQIRSLPSGSNSPGFAEATRDLEKIVTNPLATSYGVISSSIDRFNDLVVATGIISYMGRFSRQGSSLDAYTVLIHREMGSCAQTYWKTFLEHSEHMVGHLANVSVVASSGGGLTNAEDLAALKNLKSQVSLTIHDAGAKVKELLENAFGVYTFEANVHIVPRMRAALPAQRPAAAPKPLPKPLPMPLPKPLPMPLPTPEQGDNAP
jgi:hypothetical protein